MILRKCRKCGCAMDPGEGVNGICEDCVRQSKALKTRAGQLEALVKCTDYKQMSFKDLEAHLIPERKRNDKRGKNQGNP